MFITDKNREWYISRLVENQKHTHTEEQIRREVEENPQILEDFAEHLANDYCETTIKLRSCEGKYYE